MFKYYCCCYYYYNMLSLKYQYIQNPIQNSKPRVLQLMHLRGPAKLLKPVNALRSINGLTQHRLVPMSHGLLKTHLQLFHRGRTHIILTRLPCLLLLLLVAVGFSSCPTLIKGVIAAPAAMSQNFKQRDIIS